MWYNNAKERMAKMETTLNEVQQKIVEHTEGPVMVLAGAGSGKTRVLTNRIAYIIKNGLAKSYEILAITFTNKAANEIKQRLFDTQLSADSIWAMTFHSMCCKILRIEAKNLEGYTSCFSIYDEQDRRGVIKKILKERNLTVDDYLDAVSQKLSNFKMSNMTFDEFKKLSCFADKDEVIFEVMQTYMEVLKQNNAMDFDDLIYLTLQLFKTNQSVLKKYQEQFRYILVDEFQDTNESQYQLVKLLAGYHKNLFAVGDEDQSIYSWRGASIDNIKRFLNDFAGSTLYKLEQNYRSTKTIVDYANKIIKNNKNRIDKTLFTQNSLGTQVVYNRSYSDRDEAEFVASTILSLVAGKGYKFSDVAVLMRLNALSHSFEEKFMNYDIPYKIFGGVKFYERAEIKNVMAYLKLLINHQDEESFARIVNFPKRQIGDGAIQKLKEMSFGTNLLDAVLNLPENVNGTLAKFLPFKQLMLDLQKKKDEMQLFDYVKYVVDKTGILSAYSNETDEEYNKKLNINEFLHNVKLFADENPDKTLETFLQTVSLTADIDSYEEQNNTVSLATVHSVKGLEFKVVFVIGLEERYFPIIRMESSDADMEEERRLMYVAITRARERLFLTCSRSRFVYGKQTFTNVSRFVKELGYENKTAVIVENNADTNDYEKHYRKPQIDGSLANFVHAKKVTESSDNFAVGDRVFHPKFGVGYIVFIDTNTKTAKIDFDTFGNKVLSLQFAPIKKM